MCTCHHMHAGSGSGSKAQQGMVKVVPLTRANNVSIMLTQFSGFRTGFGDIRRALVTGTALSLERLSLLLQVCLRTNAGARSGQVVCLSYEGHVFMQCRLPPRKTR